MKNSQNIKQKPFGLSISVKVALESIRTNIAPTSVIICNLFYLQKQTIFPKNLDTTFFNTNKYQPTDNEKKLIVLLMEEMKKPQTDLQNLFENCFSLNWIKKIQPKITENEPLKKHFYKNKKSIPPSIVIKKTY